MLNWFAIAAGVALVVAGIWAKSLLNEVEMPATKQERENPTPTLAGRLSVIALGIGLIAYGIIHL